MAESRRGEQGAPARAQRTLTAAEKERQRPWYPKPYGLADAAAVKGVATGTASAEQQRRCIQWIINTLCGTYDMSYRPGGDDGRRDSDFAEGARSVGNQLVKLVNIDLSLLPRDAHTDPHEPGL